MPPVFPKTVNVQRKPRVKNQLHTPKKKYDEQQKVRVFFKSGNSSMLLCKNMTSLAATSLEMYIVSYCKGHNSKLEGTFIQTR